jgi:hypothetical protein
MAEPPEIGAAAKVVRSAEAEISAFPEISASACLIGNAETDRAPAPERVDSETAVLSTPAVRVAAAAMFEPAILRIVPDAEIAPAPAHVAEAGTRMAIEAETVAEPENAIVRLPSCFQV